MSPAPRPATLDFVSPPQTLQGQTLASRYLVRERIGLGGSGVVHLATDLRSGAEVVVKLLSQHLLDDPESVARFDREARRLSDTRHPNVVSMLDYGYDQGRAYLVMDYVRGESLEKRLANGRSMTESELLPIATQLLDAVGHAHEQGMMIRDIKPSNVMLCDRDGQSNYVVLLDFGLAKMLDEQSVQITRDKIVGTLGYIAPESLTGSAVDLRVDVYSLGVVFYRMLCGRLPFVADNEAAILYQTVHGPKIDITDALGPDADLSDDLAVLINDCLSRDPGERPPDASAVMSRLLDCAPTGAFALPSSAPLASSQRATPIFGTPAVIPPAGPAGLEPRSPSRAKWLGLGLVALALLSIGGWLSLRDDDEPLDLAPASATEVELPAEAPSSPAEPSPAEPSPAEPFPAEPLPAELPATAEDPGASSDEPAPEPPPVAAPAASPRDRAAASSRPRRRSPPDEKTEPVPPAAGDDEPPKKDSIFLPARDSRATDRSLLPSRERD